MLLFEKERDPLAAHFDSPYTVYFDSLSCVEIGFSVYGGRFRC